MSEYIEDKLTERKVLVIFFVLLVLLLGVGGYTVYNLSIKGKYEIIDFNGEYSQIDGFCYNKKNNKYCVMNNKRFPVSNFVKFKVK